MIKIEVQSTRAVIRSQEPLTVGLRGAKAQFTFGRGWEKLIKTAVFRQGDRTVTVADVAQEVTIPWEVLTVPGVPVEIGVYGVDSTATIAIPTLWTVTQPVRPGTEPEGDPSTEPTPGLWEQMQGKLGSLEEAIKEANNPVRVITVSHHEDDVYVADHDVAAIQSMMEAKLPFVCYWYDRDVMLQLSAFQPNGPFCFTAVDNLTEYQVVISEKGVNCTIMKLADADTKFPNPEKLTFTGVINGEYDGSKPLNVELSSLVYLVTLNSYDRAEQSFNDIKAAYNAGYVIQCDYKGFLLPLRWITDNECCFSGVAGVTSYNVVVRSAGNAIISEHSLTQKKDIPTKTSQLENDSGYLTSVPVTSVNGQTGDVTVPAAVKVTVIKESDGSYTADLRTTQIMAMHQAGRGVYCCYGEMVLPMTYASIAQCEFSGVSNGRLHTVSIGLSEITVSETAVGGGNATQEAVLYTPQELTEEQKAQARENIGLDDLPSGEETGADMDVEWKNVLDFTVEEEVSSIRLEITDIIQKLNNASDILIRFVAERVSSADVIGENPKGTISLGTAAYAPAILADKQIVPYNIYESNASGGYRVVTTIRIRNNRDWKTMEYRITPANHNHTTVYNQGIDLVYVENNNHYITVKATNSMIGINSKLNIYTLSAVKRSD